MVTVLKCHRQEYMNMGKWNTGSQISNNLAAAFGRQEASADVEVEGHSRHVQPITSNYDCITFIV